MAIDVTLIKQTVNAVQVSERLWLTEDRTRAVPEGHADAAFLYAIAGADIPVSDAVRLGIVAEVETDTVEEAPIPHQLQLEQDVTSAADPWAALAKHVAPSEGTEGDLEPSSGENPSEDAAGQEDPNESTDGPVKDPAPATPTKTPRSRAKK